MKSRIGSIISGLVIALGLCLVPGVATAYYDYYDGYELCSTEPVVLHCQIADGVQDDCSGFEGMPCADVLAVGYGAGMDLVGQSSAQGKTWWTLKLGSVTAIVCCGQDYFSCQ